VDTSIGSQYGRNLVQAEPPVHPGAETARIIG